MRIPRVYVNSNLTIGQSLSLSPERSHYLCRVLRMKTGFQLILFNGSEQEYSAKISEANPKACELEILEAKPCQTESPLNITLVQSLSKGERMDYTVQKATEMGVTQIDLIISDYTELKLDEKRLEKRMRHWREVILSAAEQSGRCHLPGLEPPVLLEKWLKKNTINPLFCLHPGKQAQPFNPFNSSHCAIVIGPEGGFSDQEVETMQHHRATQVSFGPRVLRTETVAPVALALLQSLKGDFRNH